jgi:hypothetical protein
VSAEEAQPPEAFSDDEWEKLLSPSIRHHVPRHAHPLLRREANRVLAVFGKVTAEMRRLPHCPPHADSSGQSWYRWRVQWRSQLADLARATAREHRKFRLLWEKVEPSWHGTRHPGAFQPGARSSVKASRVLRDIHESATNLIAAMDKARRDLWLNDAFDRANASDDSGAQLEDDGSVFLRVYEELAGARPSALALLSDAAREARQAIDRKSKSGRPSANADRIPALCLAAIWWRHAPRPRRGAIAQWRRAGADFVRGVLRRDKLPSPPLDVIEDTLRK